MSRLVAIEADWIDEPLDPLHRELRHRARGSRGGEQTRRRGERRLVLGACRQQRGDQDLKRILLLCLGDLLDGRQLEAVDGAGERAHDRADSFYGARGPTPAR